MKKIHAAAIALILAVSAGLGLVAATKTAGLRTTTSAAPAPSSSIAARTHRLNRIEASLRRALRDKPPALPAVPAGRRPTAAPPAQQRVIFRRPAPLVVVKHRSNHEDEYEGEHESEDGGDD